MADTDNGKKSHFILRGFTDTAAFQSPSTPVPPHHVPARDRQHHGGALRRQIEDLRPEAERARAAQEQAGLDEAIGLRVEFESFPDIELAFDRLARERSGIELLNVRRQENRTLATVFVPDGGLLHFERLITDYIAEKRDRRGHRRDNRTLIDAIEEIRAASLRSLWTDDPDRFPRTEEESLWWEVWLLNQGDRRRTRGAFSDLAQGQGVRIAPGAIEFPERTVLLAFASAAQMKRSIVTLNMIAELRRAKETAEFFDSLPPEEQRHWAEHLLERTRFPGEDDPAPFVCLLDTGVNRGHPLLSPALTAGDLYSVDPNWGVDDQEGHGTNMAGLTAFGDLTPLLDSDQEIDIRHRLESVKLCCLRTEATPVIRNITAISPFKPPRFPRLPRRIDCVSFR